MKPRIVVLGAGFAGILATKRLSLRGHAVTLVSDSSHFVERVRLHQVGTAQDVPRHDLATFFPRSRVEVLRARVTALDPIQRRVRVRTERGESALGYDYLLYALGSTVDTWSVPGVRQHTLSLATEEDAQGMSARLFEYARRRAHVVVCGGGLTGIELASEIAERHPSIRLSLVSRERVGRGLSRRGRKHVRHTLERMGVGLVDGVAVTQVREGALVTKGGAELPFDACVWAASFGVSPLAGDAGIAVNPRLQIVVNETLQSVSHPEIFAAGDAALAREDRGYPPIRMGCATAMPMAARAAENLDRLIAGKPLEALRYAYIVQFISLGRRDGLAQFVHADDSPKDRIVTGVLAAWMKEWTFAGNVLALKTGFYPL